MKPPLPSVPVGIWSRAAALLILLAGGDAAAGVIPGVSRQVQRFFPNRSFTSTSIDPATDELTMSRQLSVGQTAMILVTANGGATSSPALNLYEGGDPAPSADPSLLYAVRVVSPETVKIFLTLSDAQNNTNAVDFTGANTADFTFATADSNWCWNACANMVFPKYSVTQSQDTVAEYALIPNSGPGEPSSGRYINKPNYIANQSYANTDGLKEIRGIGNVLKGLGNIDTQTLGPLTRERVQKEVDGERPMIVLVGWYPGGAGTERRGGHFFTIYGLTDDNLTVGDPWPTNTTSVVSFDALTTTGYLGTGIWEQTLAAAKSLDLVFVIDTTDSMSDYIEGVKVVAERLINEISSSFNDYRLAVIDYKDIGEDYIAQTNAEFTDDTATVISAIKNLSAGGGGDDVPEAVYSALHYALSGTGIGAWRTGEVERQIILICDAPGHDPETFPEGQSSASVLAKASDPALPIRITGVVGRSGLLALAMANSLSGGTGGVTIDANDAADVPTALTMAVEELAESVRFPRTEVAALTPLFTFGDKEPGGMRNDPKSMTLLLERMGKTKFKPFKQLKLKSNEDAARFTSILPVGQYRWRLALSFPPLTLQAPDGSILDKLKGSKTVETVYNEFVRQPVLPLDPEIVSPSPFGFQADAKAMTYTFGASQNATKYMLEIFKSSKLWKRVTAKPSADGTMAAFLTVTVKGHKVGEDYTWRVQGLNYDRPKPVEGAFVP